MEVPVVQMSDGVIRRDLEHAVELFPRQRKAPGADVELRVLANHGPHAKLEIFRGLDGVRPPGLLGITLAEELLGRVDALLQTGVAAEEERLERAAVAPIVLE